MGIHGREGSHGCENLLAFSHAVDGHHEQVAATLNAAISTIMAFRALFLEDNNIWTVS